VVFPFSSVGSLKLFAFDWIGAKSVVGWRDSSAAFRIEKDQSHYGSMTLTGPLEFFSWSLRPIRGVEVAVIEMPQGRATVVSSIAFGMCSIDFQIVGEDGRRLCFWKQTKSGFGEQQLTVLIAPSVSESVVPFLLGCALFSQSEFNGSS
jgi:hypothetical protein